KERSVRRRAEGDDGLGPRAGRSTERTVFRLLARDPGAPGTRHNSEASAEPPPTASKKPSAVDGAAPPIAGASPRTPPAPSLAATSLIPGGITLRRGRS